MQLFPRRIRSGLYGTFLVAAGMACGGGEADHLQAANRYFDEHQYAKAVTEYAAAPSLVAKDPTATRQMGLAYAAMGNWPPAIKYLESSAAKTQGDTVIALSLGGAYLGSGRWADAAREAELVLKNAPNSLSALNLAGSAYLGASQPNKALPFYQTIARVAPADPKAKYLVGLALMAKGDRKGATSQFEAAITQSPTYLDPMTQIVTNDLAERRSGDALARVKQQLKVAGDSATLHELLALIYIARNEKPLAETSLLEVMKLSPGYLDPYVRLSELYRSEGKFDDAISIAQKALQIDPKNLSVRLVLGISYEAKGDTARAIKTYEDALALNPRFAAAGNNLAALLAESGKDLSRALQVAQAANTDEPNNPAILDTYGWVLFKAGETAKAVQALTVAASRLAEEPTVAYHLGAAQAKAGNVAAARNSLRKALSSSANFPARKAAQDVLSSLK